MSLYRIQGKLEKRNGVYYEFDPSDEPLGEGGMGKVYKGRCVDEHNGNSYNVAIKFMYSDLPPYAIEKARREAAIHFRHDNLIEMLGFIETESKSVLGEPQHHYHVVSELLEGVSLDKMFKGKLTDQNGKYVAFAEKLYKDYQHDPNHFAVEILRNVLSGLMTMHDAGFIHRDIDPTNIMITSNGHIKLIDFGIAKKMNSLTGHDKHLTQAGQFVGKPEYAAPELILGAIDEQNQTTDIYAVGILLFQCIVGHVPFEGDRSDVLQKQLHSPLPLKLIKHKGLRKIIAKATEKSRSKRFQSAAEFRVALERLDLGGGSFTPDWTPEWKPIYNYILGGIAACAMLGIGIYHFIDKIPIDPEKQNVVENNQDSTQDTDIVKPLDYATALKSLKEEHNPSKMKLLAEEGDADALFLLSRLYFQSKSETSSSWNFELDKVEYEPDSISSLKSLLSIGTDNLKAHEYLKEAVENDPKHYQAVFELACDYWRANDRTDAVEKRDGDKAEQYFNQAKTYAQDANDTKYVKLIDAYIKRVMKWRATVNKH